MMLGLDFYHAGMAIAHFICALITGLAVAARIYVKITTKQSLQPDDHFILMTLLFYYAAMATVLEESFTNFGPFSKTEILNMDQDEFLTRLGYYHKAMLAAFLLAITAQYTCKLSILLFYRRIFTTSTFHQHASLLLIVFASLWYFATTFATLCICRPLTLTVHPAEAAQITAERKKFRKYWMSMIHTLLMVDTLTDLVILLLPIRTAFTLQMARRARVGLAAIFALGGFVVVTNVVRIALFYAQHKVDPDEIFYHVAELWTSIHICTAILCASMPIYRPLWTSVSTKVRAKVTGLRRPGNDEQGAGQASKAGG